MKNIKVCGLREMNNIDELSALRIDFMGFIFYEKSPRYVGDTLPPYFLEKLPSNIKKVGVFVNETYETILVLVKKFQLDFVQLHGDESVADCERLKEFSKVIKAFRINETFDFTALEKYISCTDFFLFDTYTDAFGGSGLKFNWQSLEKYTLKQPFFLSGGIDENSAEEINKLEHKQLFAIDINSKFELHPALKDTKKVNLFIQKIKNYDNN